MKKLLLTGGGTAGHVYPNLALLPRLKPHFDEIHYIGSEGGIEKDIIKRYPEIIYHEIPCTKLIRKITPANLLIPFKLIKSICAAKKIIKEIAPDVIFSKGGFVALPVIYGAGKVPVIAHESDMSPGLANRLSCKKCRAVCASFPAAAAKMKNGVCTGAPIRESIYTGSREAFFRSINKPPFPKSETLLITGGSLGARALNNAVESAAGTLLKKYFIIHLTGKGNATKIRHENYYQAEYAHNIQDFFAAAGMVISRAGAGAVFELAALKKKALLIPLPKAESRGDQLENAAFFKQKGVMSVLYQEELTPERLVRELEALNRGNPVTAAAAGIKTDGTAEIAEMIVATAAEKLTTDN